ncbi:MAG: hypothetical protein N2Z22_06950 [Turneriella sp.]|nr:hypothetical protein [Turneriella sp.]
MRRFWALGVLAGALFADQVEYQTGLLRRAITPSADFGTAFYRHKTFRIGGTQSPQGQGIVASYRSQEGPFLLELGQRENALEQGFIIGNGAWLPWARSFAWNEPIGMRTGYAMRYAAADVQFYQKGNSQVAAARLHIVPASWLRISGGGMLLPQAMQQRPLAALAVGKRESAGFLAGAEFAGAHNTLIYASYRGEAILRMLYFRSQEPSPLANGIFSRREGFAVQGFYESWFAQYFATDGRFGMLRYAGSYLSFAAVGEERNFLGGASLRHNPEGVHLRVGMHLAQDGSQQSLLGIGFADAVFVGTGHFTLFSDQPLEPLLFPAEWYNSVLLQSSSLRIRHRGSKLIALIDTAFARGFAAVVHSVDARGRERTDFYLRIAGSMQF